MSRSGSDTLRSLRRHMIAVGALVAFTGVAGVLAADARLAGAIVASGSLVVESNVKKVQHPTGGVVAAILVQEGARVAAGDLLVRLDATVAQANLSAVTKSLWELTARRARLEAERDDDATPAFPDDLAAAAARDEEIGRIVTGEAALLAFRREALAGQEAQLRERVSQLHEEAGGLTEQAGAKEQELALIEREYVGVAELWDKKLVQITRLTSLERERARLKGERGSLMASIAQTKGKVAETELQIIQLRQAMRSDVAKELAEIRARIATLVEQKVTALDQIGRIEIRAPQAGYVHELAVHGRGAVVTGGEPLMLIVPAADALVVEIRVAPQDIAQVRSGQAAMIRFPSFNQRTTPELVAHVDRVAADVTEDKRTGLFYFTTRLAIGRPEIDRLGQDRLVPGMPAEVFIRTDERTVLSYLLKPLRDQALRAFRER